MIEAISPNEIDTLQIGPILESQIKRINEAISTRKWHNNFTDPLEIIKEWNAIILGPYEDLHNQKIRDELVEIYTKKGWKCQLRHCYSGHGPHYCFYVHKSHFN